MLGETLEQHCEIAFNQIRPAGFQNAYFEKDNDTRTGSKGDYIFREETDSGVEFISIMFEMKNEMDTTATKKKNEDFFKEKCIENGIVELDKWTKNWYSMYRGNVDNLEYFSNGKSVYQLYNHKKYEDFDIQELSKLENGDYEFIVNFYNGVTWLGEIIEEFINKLE